MWLGSIVIILCALMLTHVNSQDDEFYFNVNTNKTHTENFLSTNKSVVKEELFDTLVSEIPAEEISFDISTTERIAEEDSLESSPNKKLVEGDSFIPSSKSPLEEDSYNASTIESYIGEGSHDTLTTKSRTEESSHNVSTANIIVEEDSFDTPTREISLEGNSYKASTTETSATEDFYNASTIESTVEDDSYYASTIKTLIEEKSFDTSIRKSPVENDSFNATDQTVKKESFDVSTTEVTVEESYFNILSNEPSINDTFVNENTFGALTNETFIEDTPINEQTVEEYSFDISTSKIFVGVDTYDLSTTEVTLEEDSFYTSTTEITIETDSFYPSTTEASVEESVFDASTTEVIIEEDSIETTTSKARISDEERMSTYILKVIEHYKQPDPQGFPGAKMPDPLLVPDSSQFIAFGTNLDFTDTTLHGVNKFHIVNVTADIGKMECRANFEMDLLQVRGRYSLNTWLTSYPGGFVSDISGLKSEIIARLGVEQDGKLRAQDISIDITFKNITIQFENAGFLSSMLQGLFDSMGSMMYDTIKSYLLKDARTNMKDDINKKLDQIVGDIEFPNTISPMDMILVDVRKKIKDMKMDPLCIEDYVSNIGMFRLSLNNTRVQGLSTFHRVGNITLTLKNSTAISDFNIGTKELQGLTSWEISGMNGLLNKTGSFSFSVEYIQARVILAQAMDTRKTMKFKDFYLDVGNIQIRSDGTGTLDYIIEISANILPNLLRYQLIAAIKNPIKWKIQEELDRINVEEAIVNELPIIDKIQEDGFQLAELRRLNLTDEINFDDDEFFNF